MKWQLGAETTLIGEMKYKPGPDAKDLIIRNSRIAHAMNHIVETWGPDIKATRNAETKRKKKASATTIVMHALKEAVDLYLNEGTLNQIWDDRQLLPIADRLKK